MLFTSLLKHCPSFPLADDEQTLLRELVVGHLQVLGRRALPDPARGVVVGAVAGAVVPAELSLVGHRDAAEVGAHAGDHQPGGVLGALGVGLGVAEAGGVDGLLGGDLLGGPNGIMIRDRCMPSINRLSKAAATITSIRNFGIHSHLLLNTFHPLTCA